MNLPRMKRADCGQSDRQTSGCPTQQTHSHRHPGKYSARSLRFPFITVFALITDFNRHGGKAFPASVHSKFAVWSSSENLMGGA